MKKIIALLLVLALSVVLGACAAADDGEEIVSTIRPSSIVEPTSTEETSSQEIIIDFEEGGYDDGYGFMEEYYGDNGYGDEF